MAVASFTTSSILLYCFKKKTVKNVLDYIMEDQKAMLRALMSGHSIEAAVDDDFIDDDMNSECYDGEEDDFRNISSSSSSSVSSSVSMLDDDNSDANQNDANDEENWRQEDICKGYLVGCCAPTLFASSRHSKHGSECSQRHSVAARRHFQSAKKTSDAERAHVVHQAATQVQGRVASNNRKFRNELAKLETASSSSASMRSLCDERAAKLWQQCRSAGLGLVGTSVQDAAKLMREAVAAQRDPLLVGVDERTVRADPSVHALLTHQPYMRARVCPACAGTLAVFGNANDEVLAKHFYGRFHVAMLRCRQLLARLPDSSPLFGLNN
jgi:LUC7 N_terminus